MNDAFLLADLIACSAARSPASVALTHGRQSLSYGGLQHLIEQFAGGLANAGGLGIRRGERLAIYLEKRIETVIASFAGTAAGAVFVPINPLLKADQVAYILRDCNVRVLVTSAERLAQLEPALKDCHDLRHVVLVGSEVERTDAPRNATPDILSWETLLALAPRDAAPPRRGIDSDMAAILYTSGSTGKPKGVVLSHRNLVIGAKSVASYLENSAEDTLLAALPLSFDAGFSQLTTAFHVGARVVLLNYLMPTDVLKALAEKQVTGLTAVPPLYIQLAQMRWPEGLANSLSLRYFANTGGRMPRETLATLRERLPKARPYLMYGLTEAFRSTYLPPEEVDRRPDSIGKAIPNAEILVLREDGSPCAPHEPGELVHRGALVGMGYWNDRGRTAERYKPLPDTTPGREAGLVLPELAVFSGDTVSFDEEGFLYFVGRRDEMMKTSGYRVSPTEVEEVLYATRLVGECVAFGIDHATLGQAIQVIASPPEGDGELDAEILLGECRRRMPTYMVPAGIEVRSGPLPRNPNGKIDRQRLSREWVERQAAC